MYSVVAPRPNSRTTESSVAREPRTRVEPASRSVDGALHAMPSTGIAPVIPTQCETPAPRDNSQIADALGQCNARFMAGLLHNRALTNAGCGRGQVLLQREIGPREYSV